MSNPNATVADIARGVFDDVFGVIVHKTILERHRDHKMMVASLDATTKLPHCERCNLPRFLDPPLAPQVRGATSDPPKDTVYCERKPWCRTPGFDIYGNPFPRGDVTGRPPTKREREAAAKNGKDTPASNEDGTAPPSPSADGDAGDNRKLERGEKKASKIDEKLKKGEYVPWQTCPSCKRSLLVTRFAKHLEQCMGLSGRAASRAAMGKISGTPGGTPAPSEGGGKEDEDGDGEDGSGKGKGDSKGEAGVSRKKVLKKGVREKMKKEKGAANGSANGKLKTPAAAAAKRPPASSAAGEKRDADEMNGGEGAGAGDDEDGDTVHVKKRQKLQRVESAASLESRSTGPSMSAVERDGGDRESVDGSFIDFGAGEEGDD